MVWLLVAFDHPSALLPDRRIRLINMPAVCGGQDNDRQLCFVRAGCGDTQGVDISVHEIPDGGIYESVAADLAEIMELCRDDADVEMSFAGFCAGMADMFMALIRDLKINGFKGCAQSGSDFFDQLFVHGSTSLKGFTVTLWYTPAST